MLRAADSGFEIDMRAPLLAPMGSGDFQSISEFETGIVYGASLDWVGKRGRNGKSEATSGPVTNGLEV
jgi:hypothetical protein